MLAESQVSSMKVLTSDLLSTDLQPVRGVPTHSLRGFI